MLVSVTSFCKNTDRFSENDRDVFVNAEMKAGSFITVKFACLSPQGCATGQQENVIVYAGVYNAAQQDGTKIEGVDVGANEAAISIPEKIPLPIDTDDKPAPAVEMGTIFCKAEGYPNPAGSLLSTKASSSEGAVRITDTDCLPAFGEAGGLLHEGQPQLPRPLRGLCGQPRWYGRNGHRMQQVLHHGLPLVPHRRHQ